MIRIDEIYNNTFWRWIHKNRPGVRIFYCDPFGRSDPDSIVGHGRENSIETNYVFFFDQEPLDLTIHKPTFDKILRNNLDIVFSSIYTPGNGLLNDPTIVWHNKDKDIMLVHKEKTKQAGNVWELGKFFEDHNDVLDNFKRLNKEKFLNHGHIVTSERDSIAVDKLCKEYGWTSHYYFFHGWAALDWYRGYNKSYLITPPNERHITKTFIAPNRIIAGHRQHRLLMLYYIFKNNLMNNWISCPAVCPAENISVLDAVRPMADRYLDIESVFAAQHLPMNFPGETGHPMHSCWLSLFDESAECLLYLVSETVASGQRLHLTEKTFKPICLRMPFIIVGTQGSLAYLRSYGFRTFEGIWDESYDDEPNDNLRIQRIASLLSSLDELSVESKQDLFDQCQEVIEHNYHHFYSGAFEEILWTELQEMMSEF